MSSNNSNKRPPNPRAAGYPAAPARATTGPFVAPRLATSSTSPDLGRRQQGPPRSFVNTPKEDATPPAKHYLGNNITPRSGARIARGGSASTTPNGTPGGTPSNSRPTSIIAGRDPFAEPFSAASGIGISNAGIIRHSRAGSTVSNSAMTPNTTRSGSPERMPDRSGNPSPSPMFFHASDAKTAPVKPIAAPAAQPKGPGFFYANSELDVRSSPSPVSRDPSPVQQRPKFYHVNGDPETLRGLQTPSPPASRPSPKLAHFVPPSRPPPPRSTSPLKEFENAEPLSTGRASTSSGELKPLQTQGRPMSVEAPQGYARRISYSSVSSAQHRKTASTSSFDGQSPSPQGGAALDVRSVTSDPRISDASSSFLTDPDSMAPQTVPIPLSTLVSTSEPSLAKPTSPTSPLVSPTHSSIALVAGGGDVSKIDQANALAAQARRERKVLDLEISNSSLLAINRTLERELRKQKVELRRYRRLTSSGRISLPPISSRATSGAFSVTDTEGGTDLDPLSEAEEDELSDISDDLLSDSPTSTPSSESPRYAARQREKDSRRLQIDLERHQSLLADSQRMNQSLKRCLTWTEELINEGKRALAYTVRISEVRVGGRVLAEEDVPEGVELEQRRGLLSPGLEEAAGYEWPINNNSDGSAAQDIAVSPSSPPDSSLVGLVADIGAMADTQAATVM